ncbi:hypothetical protein [Roseivirga pacifica]|uniref:hypothetical protein n=1 Tax=Roseivirga pacifica TaxID=1267423 RepID=UPI003BAD658E
MPKFYSLIIILSCLLLACNNQNQQVESPETISFKTDDSSRLFFRNVRQIAYDKEELTAAKLNIYRYKKRSEEQHIPVLNLALVENWRFDEAYLLIEPNDFIKQNTILVKWENPTTAEKGLIEFTASNKESHQLFASKVYEQLTANSRLEIKMENEWHRILHTQEQRDAFTTTVYDYYRLTLRL